MTQRETERLGQVARKMAMIGAPYLDWRSMDKASKDYWRTLAQIALEAARDFDAADGVDEDEEPDMDDDSANEPDESMDGDLETGLASAGFGTDEDYGYFGGNEE